MSYTGTKVCHRDLVMVCDIAPFYDEIPSSIEQTGISWSQGSYR